jgi:hypothetical protein
MMNYFITVSGNIGAGKTTLVENLCNWLGWTPFFESEQHNPYLSISIKTWKPGHFIPRSFSWSRDYKPIKTSAYRKDL